jgi:glycosyltransferase involved in cell wall biosynthesis
MKASAPLVSIIIPTHNRPQLLPSAVESALGEPDDAVEVVVVPNGGDLSWKVSLAPYLSDPRVSIYPIETAHACAARNHGLSMAHGEFVRFLDDDDVLYPDASTLQCRLMRESGADICSGAVEHIDESAKVLTCTKPPAADDFIESILSPKHISQPTSYVFRRTSVNSLTWDETLPVAQDREWLYCLCRAREWKWVATTSAVGAWRNHLGARISSKERLGSHLKMRAHLLLRTVESLQIQGRMTSSRRAAAAESLWEIAHSGFHLSPLYWAKFIRMVNDFYPGTYPKVGIYNSALGRKIPPIFMECAMLPKRWANHALRLWKHKRGYSKSAIPP